MQVELSKLAGHWQRPVAWPASLWVGAKWLLGGRSVQNPNRDSAPLRAAPASALTEHVECVPGFAGGLVMGVGRPRADLI